MYSTASGADRILPAALRSRFIVASAGLRFGILNGNIQRDSGLRKYERHDSIIIMGDRMMMGYPGPNWSLYVHLGLTPAERETLRHAAGGMDNKQIAQVMGGVHIKTIEQAIGRVYDKLECTGSPGTKRVQAANWYNARRFDPV